MTKASFMAHGTVIMLLCINFSFAALPIIVGAWLMAVTLWQRYEYYYYYYYKSRIKIL